METTRLCIDGRAATEFANYGLMAQELIDQLVSAQGEEQSTSWMEQHGTVLLSHSDQVFAGQLRRFNTERKIGASPLYWAWEKNFVKSAHISAFHRFRPANGVSPRLGCPTVTTLFPPQRWFFPLFAGPQELFVVPSNHDRALIRKKYRLPESGIHVVHPCARRYVHFSDPPVKEAGWILFLMGNHKESIDLKKLLRVLTHQYPKLRHKFIRLHKGSCLTPVDWLMCLGQTQLCVYLTGALCDWPFLALEALYFGIPTLFLDGHSALNECLPNSPLRLSRFLVEQPKATEIIGWVKEARGVLESVGCFEPLGFAKQYRVIYARCDSPRTAHQSLRR